MAWDAGLLEASRCADNNCDDKQQVCESGILCCRVPAKGVMAATGALHVLLLLHQSCGLFSSLQSLETLIGAASIERCGQPLLVAEIMRRPLIQELPLLQPPSWPAQYQR